MPVPDTQASPDYAGSGMSFSELMDLPRHDRNELLARVLVALQKQLDPLESRKKEAEALLKQDLFEHKAALLDAGDYEVTEEKRQKWEYDIEGLTQLQRYVRPEVYARCITEVYTMEVNKGELNKLKKLGEEVREIIDSNCIQRTTGSKVVVKRKPQVVERDDNSRPPNVFGKTEIVTGRAWSDDSAA